MRVGDELQLRHEPENSVDANAVLVLRMGEEDRLGYIPRPLAPFIHALWRAARRAGRDRRAHQPAWGTASQQPDAPLARLEAQVPVGFDVEAALGQDVAQ